MLPNPLFITPLHQIRCYTPPVVDDQLLITESVVDMHVPSPGV